MKSRPFLPNGLRGDGNWLRPTRPASPHCRLFRDGRFYTPDERTRHYFGRQPSYKYCAVNLTAAKGN